MFIPSYSFIILDSGFYPLLPLHPGYPLPPLLHTASHHLPPHAASLAGQDFLWAPPTGSGLDADASTAANLPERADERDEGIYHHCLLLPLGRQRGRCTSDVDKNTMAWADGGQMGKVVCCGDL